MAIAQDLGHRPVRNWWPAERSRYWTEPAPDDPAVRCPSLGGITCAPRSVAGPVPSRKLVGQIREAVNQRLWDALAGMVTPSQARVLESMA